LYEPLWVLNPGANTRISRWGRQRTRPRRHRTLVRTNSVNILPRHTVKASHRVERTPVRYPTVRPRTRNDSADAATARRSRLEPHHERNNRPLPKTATGGALASAPPEVPVETNGPRARDQCAKCRVPVWYSATPAAAHALIVSSS